MQPVFNAAAIYIGLLVIMRLTGKRSLAQITTFDFVLLLIISEATQQALLGNDYSILNALIVIVTLITIDLILSLITVRFELLGKVVNGVPVVLVVEGQPLRERMSRARVSEDDILEQARATQGLERMEQIHYAVLEKSGGISIIPRQA